MDQEQSYDPHELIKTDLSSSPFVRYYIQQETFSEGRNAITLPCNQFISDVVSQLNIINRVISSNTRLTTSFIENGRDIYTKKQDFFHKFLDAYPLISQGRAAMPEDLGMVFNYSIMAMSNLILKLSINMAKISIVTITRLHMPPFLNIFIISLLFEKFLEYQLMKSRDSQHSEDRKSLVKQFPKVTVVKVAKVRSPYDSELISRSQKMFTEEAANIQFIELYEEENAAYLKYPTVKYSRYESVNLRKTLGIQSPFGFELYLLMSELIIGRMTEFKPDIIIYLEDYDSDEIAIEPRIRGLILNEFSAKVQNKIYVLKEFGITRQMIDMKTQEMGKFAKLDQPKSEDLLAVDLNRTENIQLLVKQGFETFKAVSDDVIKFKDWNNKIKLTASLTQNYPFNNMKKVDPLELKIKEMKKILFDQFTYISLALIQKSNFEEINQQFRNYVFPIPFLDSFIRWIESQKELISKESRGYCQIVQYLKKKEEKIKGMRTLSLYKANQNTYQGSPATQFFNLQTNQMDYFFFRNGDSQMGIPISEYDNYYLGYLQNFLLLALFKQSECQIFYRRKGQSLFSFGNQTKYHKIPELSWKNSSIVANNRYLYKAFGEGGEGVILRINIQKPEALQTQNWSIAYSECNFFGKNMPKSKQEADKGKGAVSMPLEPKIHGYGISYDIYENNKLVNVVLFGGGYNIKSWNEQKVTKYFYILHNDGKPIKIGKTTPQIVNESQNLRSKNILYSFIYGIPLEIKSNGESEVVVVNTNGYYENVNHHKKLFVSKIKTRPSPIGVGIYAQNRLFYQENSTEKSISNKNTILNHIISSYQKINRYENRVVLHLDSKTQLPFAFNNFTKDLDMFGLNTNGPDELSIQFTNKKLILKGDLPRPMTSK